MQIDIVTDKLYVCICGNTPKEYSIGYGPTPYYINCTCGKHFSGGSGNVDCFIDLWNGKGRNLPKGVSYRITEEDNKMTSFKEVKKILKSHGMTIRKREEEYRVNFKEGNEESAYYTDDLIDAFDTGLAMVKEKEHGLLRES